jgi:hypothetical protein
VGTGVRDAAAEPVVPSASLSVDANPACATRADVIARVQARSPRVKFDEQKGEIRIRARFSASPAGMVESAVLLAAAGAKPSLRRVLANSCNEASDAVALIIAVTLDPTAAGSATGTVDAGASPADAPSPAPPQPQAERKNAEQPKTEGRGRQTLGLQLAGQAFLGPAPAVMPAVALYATVGIDRPALWSPAVLLGVTHGWRTEIGAVGGTAAFKLDAASFDACPWRLRLGQIDARPCASALIGRLRAVGSETRNPASEIARPFWVVGGAVVLTAELPWLLEVSARVAVGANLVRDSFEFTPVVFHEVSAVTTAASLGIGLRWR